MSGYGIDFSYPFRYTHSHKATDYKKNERTSHHRLCEDVSAHDCKHYWATAALKAGTNLKSLQDAGGRNSPAMPLRYVESAKIVNEGVKL